MIDTKLLRQKLIDMAMRGLLVEQRQEEGNASDLLEEIRAEKAALIKKGQIKKEKPLPEIKEEEKPFAIPANWCWVRLGECTSYTQTKEKISAKNISSDTWSLDLEDIEKETGKIIKYCTAGQRGIIGDKVVFHKGQVLYSKLRPYLKKILIAPNDGVCTSELVPFCAYGEILPQFIVYLLKTSYVDYVTNLAAYGTNMPRVGKGIMPNLLVPLPPLAEQKRIVAALEASLKLVDTIAKDSADLDKALKFLRQKVLDMAMRGLLVEQCPEEGNASDLLEQIRTEKAALIKEGKIKKEKPLPEIKEEEKPFAIPDSWCWVRLGEIGIFKKGPFGSSLTKSMFVPKSDNAIKVYEQKNAIQKNSTLGSYYITRDYFESNMQGFEVFPGDIIVSCAGTIGETYLMPENMEKGIINQALMRIKLVPSVYLGYFLMYFDSVLKSSAQKESRGSALKNIPPFDVLKKMLVPLPPLAEQKRIVAKLEQINALIDTMLN